MKVVIVGGVAGGATAAARIRRLDEQAEIVVFERSGYVSYANCGLPYYIGGAIGDPEALALQTPESFLSRFQVTMKVRHEVTAIHPRRASVWPLWLPMIRSRLLWRSTALQLRFGTLWTRTATRTKAMAG